MLIGAINDGLAKITWEQDTFAYADAFDEKAKRYAGLTAGGHVSAVIDGESVVVKPGVAARQLKQDAEAKADGAGGVEPRGGSETPPGGGDAGGDTATTAIVRRFYGVKSLDPQRVSRDAAEIAEEVIKHLVALVDADVEVKLEISADVPSGVPAEAVRTVTENAKTLKFDQHGFEKD